MSGEIIWEEPPESALQVQSRGQYREFAEALKQNIGRWALLPGTRKNVDSARNTAGSLRLGRMKDFPKGEFEAVVDQEKVYVRYTGPKDAPEGEDEPVIPGGPDSKKVRAWGIANGFDLPERGRLPADVYEAYRKAHAVYQ